MTQTVLAVDVGGTSIKASVLDGAGRQARATERPTPVGDGPDAVVAAILEAAAELVDDTVAAVGLVVPGSVDEVDGVARYSANLGWRDVPLRDHLSQRLSLPVALGHDVGAAGLAERTLGAAAGVTDSLVLVLGAGVAGVAVATGSVVRGATGLAGEIGHIPVIPDGESCACGQRGCLETYASAAAVVRRYAEKSGRRVADARELVGLRDQDECAATVWSEAVHALGLGLATYTLLLDPSVVVLAGGLSQAGDALLLPVQEVLARQLVWRAPPQVVLSPLGRSAGQLGAGLLGWRLAGRDGFTDWAMPR